ASDWSSDVCSSDLSTSRTRAPSVRSAWPTIPSATRHGPYPPEALMAAMPLTNSTSPTDAISAGPFFLYIERHSRKTVETMLWPLQYRLTAQAGDSGRAAACPRNDGADR